VHQTGLVGLTQSVADLQQKVDPPCRRERPVTLDHLGEAHPGQVLHHVVERSVLGAPVVQDFHGVPVRQAGRGLDLAMEPGEGLFVADPVAADELDHARPFKQLVLGQIDHPHPAGADRLFETIVAQPHGAEGLPAQGSNLVDPDDAAHRRQEHDQDQARQVLDRDRGGDPGVLPRHPEDQEDRGRGNRADDDRRAPRSAGDEQRVREDQQQPRASGEGEHAPFVAGAQGEEVLGSHEEHRGETEQGEFRGAEPEGGAWAAGREQYAEESDDGRDGRVAPGEVRFGGRAGRPTRPELQHASQQEDRKPGKKQPRGQAESLAPENDHLFRMQGVDARGRRDHLVKRLVAGLVHPHRAQAPGLRGWDYSGSLRWRSMMRRVTGQRSYLASQSANRAIWSRLRKSCISPAMGPSTVAVVASPEKCRAS